MTGDVKIFLQSSRLQVYTSPITRYSELGYAEVYKKRTIVLTWRLEIAPAFFWYSAEDSEDNFARVTTLVMSRDSSSQSQVVVINCLTDMSPENDANQNKICSTFRNFLIMKNGLFRNRTLSSSARCWNETIEF